MRPMLSLKADILYDISSLGFIKPSDIPNLNKVGFTLRRSGPTYFALHAHKKTFHDIMHGWNISW